MLNGYDFYFDTSYGLLSFPITPGELSIKVGSNNDTVTLISEEDINILKSPTLTEVEFEARFPMRKYPYARECKDFNTYFEIIKKLKAEKKSFRFIVARRTPSGKRTWDTNLLMALEEFEVQENADEGDDVIISFSLKQYKEYGVKTIKITPPKAKVPSVSTTSTAPKTRSTENKPNNSTYTVVKGDCLYNIAIKQLGSSSRWREIYNLNKAAIEADAKRHGKKSSSNGHWIWSGLVLTMPT